MKKEKESLDELKRLKYELDLKNNEFTNASQNGEYELAAKHYEEHLGKSFYNRLIYYITSAPIVALVIQGYNAVESVRHMVGATDPLKADVGTIRADFAQIMQYNVIHASDSLASAEREIDIYFRPEEIYDNWQSMQELIAYDEERYNQQGL